MAAISLKLPEELLEASGRYADALRLTRAEYIRRALEQMNRETRAQLRAPRLAESDRCPAARIAAPSAEGPRFERPNSYPAAQHKGHRRRGRNRPPRGRRAPRTIEAVA